MTKSKIALLGSVVGVMLAGVAQAQDVIPPKVEVTTPGGINVVNGGLIYSVADISMGPLTLERYHLPGQRKPNNPLIGKNMSHNFDIYFASNTVPGSPGYHRPIIHIGNTASGIYTASLNPNNMDAERSGILSSTGGNYVYTDRNGTIYTFSLTVSAVGVPFTSRRVAKIDFPDGRIQTFSYDGSGNLKLVNDSSGWAIVFDYNAAADVTSACGFNTAVTYVTASSTCTSAAIKVSYGYDGNGNLTSATDIDGDVTTYPGNIVAGITCIKPPGSSVCRMSTGGGAQGMVGQQTLADGSVWGIMPSRPEVMDPEDTSVTDGGDVASVTDPDGKTTNFAFTKSSPWSITDANGNTTQYRFQGGMTFDYTGAPYHEGTMLAEATFPEGDKYFAEYNGPFRSVTRETLVAKPGAGLSDRVKQYGYGSCTVSPGTYQNCAKPIWIKDPKNNQTDYTHASHGGTLTEMQPAPSAGAPRPLKVYTYVQKYAYIKNAAGTLVAAAAPIWLPATETICQTVSGIGNNTPVCDSGALQTVTSFEYGANFTANNLLLRGKVVTSGSTSLRTCYGYDDRGNKIFETSPRAGPTACS